MNTESKNATANHLQDSFGGITNVTVTSFPHRAKSNSKLTR